MSRKKFGLGGLLAVGAVAAAAGAVVAYLRNEEIKKVTEEVIAKFKAAQENDFDDDDFEPVCEKPESCFDDDLDDGMPEVILAAEEPEKAEAPEEPAGEPETAEEPEKAAETEAPAETEESAQE